MTLLVFSTIAALAWIVAAYLLEPEKRSWRKLLPLGTLAYILAEVGGIAVALLFIAIPILVAGVRLARSQDPRRWHKAVGTVTISAVGLFAIYFSVLIAAISAVLSPIYARYSGRVTAIDQFVAGLGGLSSGIVAATLLCLPTQQLPSAEEFFTQANFNGQSDVTIDCGWWRSDRCIEYAADAEALKSAWQTDREAFAREYGSKSSGCLEVVLDAHLEHWQAKSGVSALPVLLGIFGPSGAVIGSDPELFDDIHDLIASDQRACLMAGAF